MAEEGLALAKYGVKVKNKEIADYCDDYFFSALHAWYMTKTWGMAFKGGWAEQPLEYMEAITTIESVHNEIESEESEARAKRLENQKNLKNR